uniref:Uncharacterized protein n=1 Tax=Cacopsylla melanoneura TaxID=428564 RepID=A0A8D8R6T9_9HEMI
MKILKFHHRIIKLEIVFVSFYLFLLPAFSGFLQINIYLRFFGFLEKKICVDLFPSSNSGCFKCIRLIDVEKIRNLGNIILGKSFCPLNQKYLVTYLLILNPQALKKCNCT